MLAPSRSAAGSTGRLREGVLDLAWSLWAEMGVPGWMRRHQDWALDPEPLILFTALLGESDPRLRDECVRWCVRNNRYVARARLRNLLKVASPAQKGRWGPFAATVNSQSDAGWPDATEPVPVAESSKESVDDFGRAALISLRLRTTFGVGARSEILLHFIAQPDARATAADLSEIVHYSKRNVEKELEALRKAALLSAERKRNRLEHFVARSESLLLFAAPRPDYFPRWDAIYVVLGCLLELEDGTNAVDPEVASVEARRILRTATNSARQANLPPPPSESTVHTFPVALLEWGVHIVEALARGDAKSLGWDDVKPILAREWRTARPRGVRGIVSPLLATATDLTVWADTRAAQERIPELIRRLILASTNGLKRVDMGAGEAVQRGGYDGLVETATSTLYVPEGQSVWEIGASRDVEKKADSDYEKRSANPGEVDPAVTTYVAITPRRWASKRIWERERKLDGRWRDVRFLDADDLERWLGLAPSVHAWLSALLGKSWGSVQDLQSFWSDWREATWPPLSPEVVLAGRTEAAVELQRKIGDASALVRVQGESADEALAFIAATIQGMDQADAILARSLVVNDVAGWDWATNLDAPVVLIPRFTHPTAAQAIRHGHRILLPVGREEGSPDDLVLPRIRRDVVKAALLGMGIEEDRANDLAGRARASLTSLRRSLAVDKGLARPAWAHRVMAPALLPALLAGAWDETKLGDQEVISQLAERPYKEVERSLVGWADVADPPVRKIGTMWFLVSKEDAWRLLSPNLTPTDLARFGEVLLRALGIRDPALELPTDQRWMANVLGHEHPLSAQLREGLVDTLAIMGARGEDTTFLTGQTGQWHADAIVRALLDRANADETGKLWASLSGVLPLLAEAVPGTFLQAVDVALSREPCPLLTLFSDADLSAAFFASSPHTGLLWALENLGWSSSWMALAAQRLASLSRIDPGGKLVNRPFGSLRSIFLIWNPQTAAPLSARFAALDILRRQETDIAWRLMLAILPRRHDVSTPSHAPRWRDWNDTRSERVPFEEYHQAIDAVMERLLEDVGANGPRWRDLIRVLGDLPGNAVFHALESLSADAFTDEDRAMVWSTLRSVISDHRRSPDAEWALPCDVVDRLEGVYERLAPNDPIRRVAWLFTQHPNLLDGQWAAWNGERRAVQNARFDAIQYLREQDGLGSLVSLAHAVEQPGDVGHAIGQNAAPLSDTEQKALLDLLDAPDPVDRMLAVGFVAGRFEVRGWEWVRPILERTALDWVPERRAAFLSSLPFAPETWDYARRLGEDTERAYWSGALAHWIDDPAGVERAAAHLVRYGRAGDAVDLLGRLLQDTNRSIDTNLVTSALELLLHEGVSRQRMGLAHDVATLLDYLGKSGTFEPSRLAQLEWAFLPLLERDGLPATTLLRELACNPRFFVDILCAVFRAQGEEPRESTEAQQTQAMLGYRLLDSWHRPPGVLDDGSVEGETLTTWVEKARSLASTAKREEIADQQIGRVLRYVPDDPDGLWPNREVRDLVERIGSHHLETGLELGLHNSRDVTWRSVSDGGAQERALQVRYLMYAQQVNAEWPRTAAMLRRIARSFSEEARRHDEQAELTAESSR